MRSEGLTRRAVFDVALRIFRKRITKPLCLINNSLLPFILRTRLLLLRRRSHNRRWWLILRPLCPGGCAWLHDLRVELLAFPTGRHDDQVDALGLCGQLMDRFALGYVPREPDPAAEWDRAYRSDDEIYGNRRDSLLTL